MEKTEMTTKYEEMKQKVKSKVVYVWVVGRDNGPWDWYGIDPRRNSAEESVIPIDSMTTPGEYHDQIFEAGTAFLGSKVYFIGGVLKGGRDRAVNTVSIYDTIKRAWTQGPPMKESRYPLAVVVVGHKIYVFGTLLFQSYDMPVDVHNWVECFDSLTGKWNTISGPDFLDSPAILGLRSFAVVLYGDEIRFLDGGDEVHSPMYFVFNHLSETWEMPPLSPGPELPTFTFDTNHVVYGEFALWNWYDGVYAWDLTSNKTSFLFNLEDKAKWWSEPIEHYHPVPTYLLHLGNGLMCIVKRSWNTKYGSRIVCYTFEVLGTPLSYNDDCRLSLGKAAVSYYSFPTGCYLSKAIALSAEDVGFGTVRTT